MDYPKVEMLIEFKFSRYATPFDSYHVQLQAEGILLNTLGFDTDSLYYLIIIAPLGMEKNSELLNSIPARVYAYRNRYELGTPIIFDSVKSYLFKFDEKIAQQNLVWALDFWNTKRDAQKTENKNKCRSCDFHEYC